MCYEPSITLQRTKHYLDAVLPLVLFTRVHSDFLIGYVGVYHFYLMAYDNYLAQQPLSALGKLLSNATAPIWSRTDPAVVTKRMEHPRRSVTSCRLVFMLLFVRSLIKCIGILISKAYADRVSWYRKAMQNNRGAEHNILSIDGHEIFCQIF